MRVWLTLIAGMLVAVLSAGCGSNAGGSSGDSPIGSVHRSGTVPLRIVTSRNSALAVASVTINGQGPFPFIVDTGASRSVIDQPVARHLGLSTKSTSRQVSGVGCQTKAATAQVSHWKAGGLSLPPDRVNVLKIAAGSQRASAPQFAGLLGSDVLSRFGAAAIDYQAAMLRLGASAANVSGGGVSRTSIHVVHGKAGVLAVAPVRVQGRGPFAFIVDSGAESSVVDSAVAKRLQLRVLSSGRHATGVACQVKTSTVKVTGWKVGSTGLPGHRLTEITLPRQTHSHGVQGLLGSGTLKSFGTIAINYAQQRLVLAPRLTTPRGGVSRLVVRHAHGSTFAVVPVKIDGKGPYPFALDTGASRSVVGRSIARAAALTSTGKTTSVSGVISARSVPLNHVGRWSVGGVSLPAADVASVKLAGRDGVKGLLGSDVLRHFALITVDYKKGQLQLGQAASSPSSAHAVPLEELSSHGATELLVPVSVSRRGPFAFALDTGATRSAVSQSLAQRLGLHPTGTTTVVKGVVSASRAALVSLRHWSAGSVALPHTKALVLKLSSASGLSGLLGSDVLRHFGTVTVNYRKDQLLLP